jgi:hypothetical protein
MIQETAFLVCHKTDYYFVILFINMRVIIFTTGTKNLPIVYGEPLMQKLSNTDSLLREL